MNGEIYICRHGESLFNRYGLPEKDCGLTNVGINQASKLTGYVDYVICSPMKRAKETLKYSKIKYGHMEINSLCREKKESICDFLINEDVNKESHEDIKNKAIKFWIYLNEIRKKYKKILVVSHNTFLTYLIEITKIKNEYKNIPRPTYVLQNAVILKLI